MEKVIKKSAIKADFFGASAGTRTQNNGSVDHRDIHFTTNAYLLLMYYITSYFNLQ